MYISRDYTYVHIVSSLFISHNSNVRFAMDAKWPTCEMCVR